MEEKKNLKVSLSTVFLIIAIIAIAIMGYYIYTIIEGKETADKEVQELSEKVSSLEQYSSNLQEKINSIEGTISNESTGTTNTVVNSTETSNENYKDMNASTLGEKDVLFVTNAKLNNDGTYTLKGVVYKHDDINKNENQIEDRWILSNDHYMVTISSKLNIEIIFDDENEYKTVDDYFKNYNEAEAKNIANPDYKNCFKFTFSNGKCTKIENVLTGIY